VADRQRGGTGAEEPGRASRVELLADADRPGAWMLLMDGIPQSHVDLGEPRHLELEYMRRLGHLADLAAPPGAPLRALHLGGGGLTLARYIAATRPGSGQLAVESDAEVAALVRARLPLNQPGRPPRGTGQIKIRLADARAALERLPPGSYDIAVMDAFAGARTPAHLTSVEFTSAAAAVLAPSGIFAVNVGDGPPLAHARSRTATVCAVFRHVCLIAEPGVLRGRRFGNLVIAASGAELPAQALIRRIAGDPFPARLLAGEDLDRFVAGARAVTDSHATPSPPMPPEVFA